MTARTYELTDVQILLRGYRNPGPAFDGLTAMDILTAIAELLPDRGFFVHETVGYVQVVDLSSDYSAEVGAVGADGVPSVEYLRAHPEACADIVERSRERERKEAKGK